MKNTLLTVAACLCLLFAFGAQADEAVLFEPVEPACQSSDLVGDAVPTEMPEATEAELMYPCSGDWTETQYRDFGCGSCSRVWGSGILTEKRTRTCTDCNPGGTTTCSGWSSWSYHGCYVC